MEEFAFDRDAACPACGIGLEIRGVCRERRADLAPDRDRGGTEQSGHLHVECPGCGLSGYMDTASRGNREPESRG